MDSRFNVLAGVVHAVIAVLNMLAFGYNWLGGNKKRAVFHAGIAAYESHATYLHVKGGRV